MKLIPTAEARDREAVLPVAVPGEPCPTCGQRTPHPDNVFATGAYGAVPIPTIELDSPLDPEGEDYTRVMIMFREGWTGSQIGDTYQDLTPEQIAAVEEDFLNQLHADAEESVA